MLHVAILQRGIAPADARHLARETGQVGRLGVAVIAVRSTAGVGPGERRTVVGIVLVLAAGKHAIMAEADLIAVVKRGRAGIGEGKEPPFLHALHRGRVAVVVALLEQETHAVGVVRARQVHHGFQGHRRVVFLDRTQAGIELRRGDGADRAAGTARIAVVVLERCTARAAVAGAAGEEPAEHGGTEAIVHDAVPLAAQQPGRGIAPLLAQGDGLRVDIAYGRAEAFPVIVGRRARQTAVHIAAHVEAPAAGALVGPVGANGVEAVAPDQGAHRRRVGLQLGQRAVAVPGLVGVGAAVTRGPAGHAIGRVADVWIARAARLTGRRADVGDVEPTGVGAARRLARAAVGVTGVVVEIGAVRRGVVEDAVQDELEAMRVGGRGQGLEVRQGPEIGVNLQVVGGVVLVIGRRLEDWVEVEDADAQVVEVTGVDLLRDASQITAVEVVAVVLAAGRRDHIARVAHGRIPGRAVGAHDRGVSAVEEAPCGRIICGVAVAETIREDLVDYAFLHPGRYVERRVIDGDLKALLVVVVIAHGAVAAAIELGIIVRVEVLVRGAASAKTVVVDLKEVIEDGRISARGDVGYPPIIDNRIGVERAVPGHIHVGFRVGAVVPDAHARAGDVALGHTQAQLDRCVRRGGANDRTIVAVKGIVQHLVPEDVAVGRALRRDHSLARLRPPGAQQQS